MPQGLVLSSLPAPLTTCLRPRFHDLRRIGIAIALAAIALANLSGNAWAAKDPEKLQDWTVICNDKDGKESCFTYVLMVEPESRKPVFKMQVGHLAASQSPIAMFVLPLGVKVGAGVQLRVDKAEPINFPFEACTRDGCTAFLRLDDKNLATIESGEKVTFVYLNREAKPVGIDISLKGFPEALKKVK